MLFDSRFRRHALFIAGILLIGANLRPAITGVAPLAERMLADQVSRELIGLLTTIPLILFGLAGMMAGWLGARLGFARALFAGMLLLSIGCLLRTFHNELAQFEMFLGTVFIGAGIAVGNVLLPGIVKSRYPNHIGVLTSLYSTAMNLGAAFGLALAVPMALHFKSGWHSSLKAWAAFALLAGILWIPQILRPPLTRTKIHPLAGIRSLIRKPRAWQVTAYMGLQSMVFYSSVAWLPTVLQSRGMSETTAAGWVTAMQLCGCAASLFVPILAGRIASQSAWAAGCGTLNLLGITGILFLPTQFVFIATILLGIGLNASFSLVLLIIAMRSANAVSAGHLSSMAQAIGYLLAAPAPWLVGWLVEETNSWPIAFGAIAIPATLTVITGWLAGRKGTVDTELPPG